MLNKVLIQSDGEGMSDELAIQVFRYILDQCDRDAYDCSGLKRREGSENFHWPGDQWLPDCRTARKRTKVTPLVSVA